MLAMWGILPARRTPSMTMISTQETPLARAVRIVSRHWPAMAAFFFVVLAAVAGVTAVLPPSYRSQAKLFLRLGRENVTLDPTAALGQTPAVALPATRENEVN